MSLCRAVDLLLEQQVLRHQLPLRLPLRLGSRPVVMVPVGPFPLTRSQCQADCQVESADHPLFSLYLLDSSDWLFRSSRCAGCDSASDVESRTMIGLVMQKYPCTLPVPRRLDLLTEEDYMHTYTALSMPCLVSSSCRDIIILRFYLNLTWTPA